MPDVEEPPPLQGERLYESNRNSSYPVQSMTWKFYVNYHTPHIYVVIEIIWKNVGEECGEGCGEPDMILPRLRRLE